MNIGQTAQLMPKTTNKRARHDLQLQQTETQNTAEKISWKNKGRENLLKRTHKGK